jgi:hypothetical protein
MIGNIGSSSIIPRGIRNNNPGNIDKGRQIWHGEIVPGSDTRFIQFSSMPYGVRCMAIVLSQYIKVHGLNTIAKIIARWAPSVENDTEAYVKHVASLMGIDAYTVLPTVGALFSSYLAALIEAIIIHENGKNLWVTENDITTGLLYAGEIPANMLPSEGYQGP